MPFKDIAKRRKYHREYQKKRRDKQKFANQLLSDHYQACKIGRKNLRARIVMPISLEKGSERFSGTPKFWVSESPVIHTSFKVGDKESLEKATAYLVEAEDMLALVGEHKDWPALGIQGLATVKGRLHTETKQPFSTDTLYSMIKKAIKLLRKNKHKSPYALVANSKWETAVINCKSREETENICKLIRTVVYSPVMTDKNGDPNILVMKPNDKNRIVMCYDWQVVRIRNTGYAKLHESITPIIGDPSAICELRFNVTL